MNLKSASKARYFTKDTPLNDKASKENQNHHSVHFDASCPICQEPVGHRNLEGKTESWSQLPCGHKFGSHCIKRWLGMVGGDKPCCPICRQNASYLCGHPVLPVVIPGNRRGKDEGGGGLKMMESTFEQLQGLQYGNCVFCRQALGGRTRTKKRAVPWSLVKGCWWRVWYGKTYDRNPLPEHAPLFGYPGVRDTAWEKWWRAQEPRNA